MATHACIGHSAYACAAAPQFRMLSQFVNILDVTVLPPHVPSAEERGDPELFAAHVRAQYVEATGSRPVEQGQREFVALCKVRGLRV